MAKVKFYAVKRGLIPGVYTTWNDCKLNVDGYPGAEYKSFTSREEAEAYVAGEIPNVKPVKEPPTIGVLKPRDLGFSYAFVDGSFNKETSTYGYGGFLIADGKLYPLKGSANDPEMANMRNVAGEICGAMAAMITADILGLKDLTIFYDYDGIEAWYSGRWKAKNMYTQQYASFMRTHSNKIKLYFTHVKGHSGVDGNEIADAMAKSAVGFELTAKQRAMVDMITINKSGVDINSLNL